MSILTLSGWTQPADALDIPGAQRFDYSDYASPEDSYAGLAAFADTEHVVGWSMGGQLAIRAIAAGVLAPKRLTLVGAPYQFVSGDGFHGGMDPVTFAQFRDSYAKDAERTAQRFAALMGKGDREGRRISASLRHHPHVTDTSRWMPWLERLGSDSLREADLSMLPPTLIIHGAGDQIVPITQGETLAAALPQARLERWEGAGHAPHLHDRLRFLETLERHAA